MTSSTPGVRADHPSCVRKSMMQVLWSQTEETRNNVDTLFTGYLCAHVTAIAVVCCLLCIWYDDAFALVGLGLELGLRWIDGRTGSSRRRPSAGAGCNAISANASCYVCYPFVPCPVGSLHGRTRLTGEREGRGEGGGVPYGENIKKWKKIVCTHYKKLWILVVHM